MRGNRGEAGHLLKIRVRGAVSTEGFLYSIIDIIFKDHEIDGDAGVGGTLKGFKAFGKMKGFGIWMGRQGEEASEGFEDRVVWNGPLSFVKL
ncbi:hypothetical protein HPP92_026112 [Vanilla planifolia]|uniref:Uncharacterized protein n=1 Tax=Vanilla planifolia TaxID=51239 RepID=A0A835UAF1_VANPL|nr:hypothetical protein HPP92_026112 [Vanilla planifolia]